MINTQKETMVLLIEAARSLKPRPVAVETLWRWRAKGVRGVKLETVLMGGRRFTSWEALERFFNATTVAGEDFGKVILAPLKRERALARAEKRAAELGV